MPTKPRPKVKHPPAIRMDFFFDLIPDLACIASTDGYFKKLNLAWEPLLGYTREELLAIPLLDLIHPADREQTLAEVSRQRQGQRTFGFINRYRAKNGQYHWLEWTATPARNKTLLYATARDITARKLTDRQQSLLIEVLRILNESSSLHAAIDTILAAILRAADVDAVGIRLRQGDDFPYFFQSGFSDDFLATENTLTARTAQGDVCRDENGNPCLECTCGLVLRGKTDPNHPLFTPFGSFWSNDTRPLLDLPPDQDPRLHPRNRCIHAGFCSLALIPIRANNEILGLLQLNAHRTQCFTLDTIRFFEGLGNCIGIALAREQAAKALQENETRFRLLIDRAPDAIFVQSNGSFVYLNPAALRLFGADSENKLLATPFLDRMAPEFHAAIRDRIRHQRETGTPAPLMEQEYLRLDGSRVWVETTAVNIHFQGSDAHLVFVRDINERKQVQEALRISLSRQAALLAAVPDIIMEVDNHKIYRWANQAGLDFFGADVIGNEAASYFDGKQTVYDTVSPLFNGSEQVVYVESWQRRKDGQTRLLAWWCRTLKDAQGVVTGALSTARDITERRRAEVEAESTNALIQAVVENVPLMIFLKEATDLRFVIFNRAGEELLGYDRSALLGRNNLDLFPPEQAAHFMAKDREVLNGEAGVLDIPEEPIQTAGKGQRLLHTRKVCIRGRDGTSKYLLGISEDITERKQAEAEAQQMRNALYHMDRVARMGEMATSLAHELNQPLTGILCNAQAAQQLLTVSPPDLAELGAIQSDIVADAKRASEVIHRLRSFLRRDTSARESMAINNLVTEIIRFIRMDNSLRDVSIETNLAEELPEISVDRIQIQEVLVNLIFNAAQASPFLPDAGRRIIITTAPTNDPAGVRVTVRDNGTGFTQERLAKAFDPYFTTKPNGLGMGLPICRSIIEAHSGRIWAENHLDGGAMLSFTLPAGSQGSGVRGP